RPGPDNLVTTVAGGRGTSSRSAAITDYPPPTAHGSPGTAARGSGENNGRPSYKRISWLVIDIPPGRSILINLFSPVMAGSRVGVVATARAGRRGHRGGAGSFGQSGSSLMRSRAVDPGCHRSTIAPGSPRWRRRSMDDYHSDGFESAMNYPLIRAIFH